MIYDTSIFLNEFELLKIRLDELWDVVDVFIVAEANMTFSGKPKPLSLTENLNEFHEWHGKLLVVQALNIPSDNGKWTREEYQRECVLDPIKFLHDNDLLIHGDADEIPSANGIKQFQQEGIAELGMTSYIGYFNAKFGPHDPKSRIMTGKYLCATQDVTFQERRLQTAPIIPNAGWEFVYCAPPEVTVEKLQNFSHHDEPRMESVRKSITKDFKAFVLKHDPEVMPIDASFPKRIVRMQDHYKKLGLIL